jgi:hypothetical protein
MRLEDDRNQVQVDDEWAWDWDGVQRTRKFSRRLAEAEEDWYDYSPKKVEDEVVLVEEVRTSGQIDSSTWTKSKGGGRSSSSQTYEEKVGLELENSEKGTGTEPLITPTLDSDPPPVIEFTPEFYRLVKYGSSGSVNENELGKGEEGRTKILISSRRGAPKSSTSSSSSDVNGKMDDKISQTDFGSSLENLSISSELFTECRNCLELVKRLVGGIDEASNGGTGYGSSNFDCQSTTTLDRARDQEDEERKTDHGSSTTWVSVPKGLPTSEVTFSSLSPAGI